jgi:catechol 2,3-dioxygenase-like lactoylglutathione lyase family enzyme
VAAAFAVLAYAVPSAADPLHARVTRYDNVHIRVADPAKAVEWYVKHLGARSDGSNARVHFGDTVVAIVATKTPQPSAGSVIDHFAVSFADVDGQIRALEAAGITVKKPQGSGFAKSGFIEDPWGARIELLQDPSALGFHHVHLSVADPQAVLAWYQERLGGERGKLGGSDGLRYGKIWLLAERSTAAAAPSAERAIMNVAWRVADIQRAIAELQAKGVQVVTAPRQIGDLWYAFVEGPDGVRTELLQRSN